jgi:CheY-like chemotaxis protein
MTVTTPRLLVVSESRITRRVIEMTFADQSVELVSATTGPDGFAEWERHPASVVIADLVMDGLDGLSLARQIADRGGDRAPAVLLLASQTDLVDDAAMAAASVRAVLRKPLDSLQLVEAVRSATRNGRPAAAPVAVPVEPVATPTVAADGAPLLEADEVMPIAAPAVHDAQTAADTPAAWHDLRDADLERVAERVAAIWSGDQQREQRVTALVAERAGQLAATSAAAAVERVAPAAASEAAERLVRELAPKLVAEVARLVVADVSERLVREEIARLRAGHSGR